MFETMKPMKSATLVLALAAFSSCYEKAEPITGYESGTTGAQAEADGSGAVNTDETPAGDATASNNPPANTDPAGAPTQTPPATTPPAAASTPPAGTAATGKVAVDFTPVAPIPVGQYSPRNVLAVFVTDANNNLVRTLFATPAGPRALYLRRWRQLAGNLADGFTGATINTATKPATAPFMWDMKNRAGVVVPNGNYKVWFEVATANIAAITPAAANAGLSGTLNIDAVAGYKNLIVPIVVGPTGSNKTDTTNQAFTNVSIIHTP